MSPNELLNQTQSHIQADLGETVGWVPDHHDDVSHVTLVSQCIQQLYLHYAVLCLVAQLCLILQPHGLQPARLLCPWDFPGKNAGVGCHALLQGIFPTQGSKPGLLHCRVFTLYFGLLSGK